ncbi:hypothetical protein VPH35_130062 [Triticum aestivum]
MHVPPPVSLPCAHFLPSAAGMRAAHASLHCHLPPPGRPPGSAVRNRAAAHHLVITTASSISKKKNHYRLSSSILPLSLFLHATAAPLPPCYCCLQLCPPRPMVSASSCPLFY